MDQEESQQQREGSEPSKEEFEDNDPVVIFDGVCKHEWYFDRIDVDGHGRAFCKKCPMGKIYKPDEMEVKDGKLITKSS